MSDTDNTTKSNKKDRKSKVKRQSETNSILTPIFAASHRSTNNINTQTETANGSIFRQETRSSGLIDESSLIPQSTTVETTVSSLNANLSSVPARSFITSSNQPIQANLMVNEPGDVYEQEADRIADDVMRMPDPSRSIRDNFVNQTNPIISRLPSISRLQASGNSEAFEVSPEVESRINQMKGQGQTLPAGERQFFESRMGYDFSTVRVHTDANAIQASRDIQAQAFTVGNNIAFSAGAYQPGTSAGRRLLAHELTHVVQQTGSAQRKLVQRAIATSYETTHGEFKVTDRSSSSAVTPGGSNLPIKIQFHPNETAPYSNQIGLIQIVKLTNSSGANVEPMSLPAARGASLRTSEDADSGVEGGFFTDTLHNDSPASGGAGTDAPAGSALPPQYPFGNDPAQPNPATPGLSRPDSGGGSGATVGFKRSNDPADIKAAELTDAPGYRTVNPANADLDFKFETVAKGEDTMTIYGALKWSVEIRNGVTTNETASVDDSQSSTFDAALEAHRDFYVHEPVIFYFDFNSRVLSAEEANKIDTFLDYLARYPDVEMTATGYADMRGGASKYNMDLSMDRASAVEDALLEKGVPESQISGVTVASGATDDFTQDATTNQDDEANRRANRRVVLTFEHVPGGGATGGTT